MSIPILYESGTTDFWNMGLGPLSDTLEATVTEQRNGEFYLDLSYPIDGARANELKNNRIIVADAGHSLKAQQFDITEVQRGLTKLTIHAEHVSYRTSRYPLTPTFEYTGNADGAIRAWQKAIVVDNNITADSDISTTGTVNLTIDKAQNARQVLGGIEGSILDVYGGEYRFDNEHISLLNHRGSVVNTLLAYGRNITDFNQEEAIGETYTSIYPYALVTKPGEDEVTLITLPEYYVDGDYVKNFPQRRVLPVDLSSKFGDKNPTTVDGLRTAAKAYVKANQVGVPKVSTTISFVDLSKTTDYADVAGLEEVNLCDEVPFWFSKYDIRTTAKVSSVVWNVLSDSYNSITLGDLAASLSESIQTIATQTASQEASKAIITVLQGADGLTNNFYSDGVSTSPTAKKIGDRWFAKNGDKTSLYIWDGVAWREIVSTDTADKIAADIDAKMAQLNADMSTANSNLQAAKQDVADLQNKLKANDEAQAQLKNDLSANSTILEKAQADIVTNAEDLTALDAKLKANDEAQAQLQNDLAANTKVQDQLKNDLAANSQLVTQNKEDVDAALKSVNETLTQAQTDAATAVKNADLAVTNAQSAVDASGLATNTANSASDAALAAKNLATSTANDFDRVKSQAATASSDAANAISTANKAQGDATSALGNSNTAIGNAKDALNKVNGISVGGTNLLRNSKGKFQPNKSVIDNWDTYGSVGTAVYMVQGQQYTVHADASSGLVWSATHNGDVENNNVVLWLTNKESVWAIISDANTGTGTTFTWNYPSGTYYIRVNTYKPDNSGYVENVKIEKGNLATDWSPAPEDVQVQISNINGELSQKVSQTDYDNLKGTVTSQGTLIDQNSKAIELKANQSTVDTLSGEVSDNTAQLKLTATAASLEVTSKKVDTLSQTVTDQGAKLDLTATSAQLKVTENKVDALNKTVSDNSAQLKLTATSAALETQSKRVDTISGQVDTNTAGITAANGAIELKADTSTVNTLSDTVKQQGIDIKAAQGQLALKLTQDDLTNGLNGYATQTWAQQLVTVTANGLEANLSTLKANVDNMQVGGRNLHVASTETDGYWADKGGLAGIGNANDSRAGDFISITPTNDYILQYWLDEAVASGIKGWVGYTFWDKDKKFISYYTSGEGVYDYKLITFSGRIPSNAAYIKVSYYRQKGKGRVKLEEGTLATDWSPAPEDQSAYTDTQIANLKLTVDGLTGTFAKQTDLDKATSDFQVTADGLNLLTTATGTNGEKVTQVIADVNNIKNTMTGPNGYTTRLQTLEGFQQTATKTLNGVATSSQVTQLADQITSVVGGLGQTNLVYNSEFENNAEGWDKNSYYVTDNSITNQYKGSTGLVCKITTDSIWGRFRSKPISVSPGEFISASVSYYRGSGTFHSGGLYIYCYANSTDTTYLSGYGHAVPNGPQRQLISLENYQVPEGAHYVRLGLEFSGICWITLNQPMLVRSGTIGPYVRDTAGSSQITQLQNQIDLRTTVDGKVTDALNLSNDGGGTVKIQGASLYVTAASHFDDASIQSASIASLDATKITSGYISADRLATTELNADNITSGSISADRLATTKLNASNITSGSINAGLITTGVLSADRIYGGTFDASKMTVKNIDAGSITSGSIATALLASTEINADNITSGTIAAARIATTALSATNITSGTLDVGKLTVKNLSADLIASGTIDASLLSTTKLNATNITAGTLDLGNLTVKNLKASLVVGGIFDASTMNVINLNGNSITAGTITADKLATNALLVGLNNSLSKVNITPTSIEIARSDINLTSISLNSNDGILFSKGANDIAGMHAGYTGRDLSGQLVLDTYLTPAANGQRWGRIISNTSSDVWMSYFWDEVTANKQGQPAGLNIDANVIFRGNLYSKSATTSNDPHLHLSTMTQASGTHGIALLNDNNTGIEIDNDNNIYWVRNNVRTKVTF